MSTILLADDDQLLRLIMRERLERAGHEVLECGDGFAALEIAMQDRPDCLVLDVMMPLARGLEVVRQVRRQDDWHPGIVMVSARTRVTDRLNALDAGADIYLEKPLELTALVEAVERVTRDTTPTRIVDILGPVWATLAMDRLFQRARQTAPAPDVSHLIELFGERMRTALGRRTPDVGEAPMAMRVLWEHTLRNLIGDVADPVIPIATDIHVPEALTALASAGANLRLPVPSQLQTHVWARTLGAILESQQSAERATFTQLQGQFATALQRVLGLQGPSHERWTLTLATALGRGDATGLGTPAQRLEATISRSLGDMLGLHTVNSDRWAQTLARVLAYRTADARLEAHFAATLHDALAGGDGALGRAADHGQDLWGAAMDEILRGQGGPIVVPDVLGALAAGHERQPGRHR